MTNSHLIAKGFTLSYRINHQKMLAPVAKLNVVQVLLSLASNLDCQLFQFDIEEWLLQWRLGGRSVHGYSFKV